MLRDYFAEEKIEYFGVIPFSACRLRRPDIIERKGVSAQSIQSAVMFLIPYYVHDGAGNISLYARAGDYHHYSDALFERLLPKHMAPSYFLRRSFPQIPPKRSAGTAKRQNRRIVRTAALVKEPAR